MWNLVISTIVFFIVAWYVRRFLEEQGFSHGKKRDLLIFVFASLVSWGAGEGADWVQEKIEGKSQVAKNSSDLSEIQKVINQIPK
jgi:hypothetical protein